MQTGIDWVAVRAELDSVDWEEDFDCQNQEIRTVFLGSVFDLTPSGKYYMPWACSNVTEEEAEADEEWYEMLEDEASDHGLFVSSGEGDPCDLLVGEVRTSTKH